MQPVQYSVTLKAELCLDSIRTGSAFTWLVSDVAINSPNVVTGIKDVGVNTVKGGAESKSSVLLSKNDLAWNAYFESAKSEF